MTVDSRAAKARIAARVHRDLAAEYRAGTRSAYAGASPASNQSMADTHDELARENTARVDFFEQHGELVQ